jgi:hypothetical protein
VSCRSKIPTGSGLSAHIPAEPGSTHHSLSTTNYSLPLPVSPNYKLPPTPSNPWTSPRLIRMIPVMYYNFTVITNHAIIPVFVSQNSLAFPYSSFLRPFSASSALPRLRSGASSARHLCLCSGRASARRPFPRPRHAPNLQTHASLLFLSFPLVLFLTSLESAFTKKPGVGAPLSIQNRLTRFGRLCRRVCPFASFGYNARPFAREVNR